MSVREQPSPITNQPDIGVKSPDGTQSDFGLKWVSSTTWGLMDLDGTVRESSTNTTKTLSKVLKTTNGVASGLARTTGGQVFSAAGVAVHDSSAEAISVSTSIPASSIVAGTNIKVRGRIRATATVSTDTLTYKLYIGTTTLTGTALIASAATDVANNDTGWFEFDLFGTAAAGATAAVVGFGKFVEMAGTTVKSAKLDTTTFATNGALLIELSLKWSTANANSALVEWMVIEIVG